MEEGSTFEIFSTKKNKKNKKHRTKMSCVSANLNKTKKGMECFDFEFFCGQKRKDKPEVGSPSPTPSSPPED